MKRVSTSLKRNYLFSLFFVESLNSKLHVFGVMCKWKDLN